MNAPSISINFPNPVREVGDRIQNFTSSQLGRVAEMLQNKGTGYKMTEEVTDKKGGNGREVKTKTTLEVPPQQPKANDSFESAIGGISNTISSLKISLGSGSPSSNNSSSALNSSGSNVLTVSYNGGSNNQLTQGTGTKGAEFGGFKITV